MIAQVNNLERKKYVSYNGLEKIVSGCNKHMYFYTDGDTQM